MQGFKVKLFEKWLTDYSHIKTVWLHVAVFKGVDLSHF